MSLISKLNLNLRRFGVHTRVQCTAHTESDQTRQRDIGFTRACIPPYTTTCTQAPPTFYKHHTFQYYHRWKTTLAEARPPRHVSRSARRGATYTGRGTDLGRFRSGVRVPGGALARRHPLRLCRWHQQRPMALFSILLQSSPIKSLHPARSSGQRARSRPNPP